MLILSNDKYGIITLERAREALRNTVNKYGADMKYRTRLQALGLLNEDSSCVFSVEVKNGPHNTARVAACLIGVIMVNEFGYSVEDFVTCGQNGSGAYDLFTVLPDNDYVKAIDAEAIEYLSVAQSAQDSNRTWGAALDEAEQWAKDTGWIPLTEEEQAIKDAENIDAKVKSHVHFAERVNGDVLAKIENESKVQAVKFMRDSYHNWYGGEYPNLAAVVRAYKILKERVDSKNTEANEPPF